MSSYLAFCRSGQAPASTVILSPPQGICTTSANSSGVQTGSGGGSGSGTRAADRRAKERSERADSERPAPAVAAELIASAPAPVSVPGGVQLLMAAAPSNVNVLHANSAHTIAIMGAPGFAAGRFDTVRYSNAFEALLSFDSRSESELLQYPWFQPHIPRYVHLHVFCSIPATLIALLYCILVLTHSFFARFVSEMLSSTVLEH